MIEEDIGWIKANIETLLKNQESFSVRLIEIEHQISIYKTVIKTIKFTGAALLLVLTFKFGNVADLWHRIFS